VWVLVFVLIFGNVSGKRRLLLDSHCVDKKSAATLVRRDINMLDLLLMTAIYKQIVNQFYRANHEVR
jgi:hypothetical protein